MSDVFLGFAVSLCAGVAAGVVAVFLIKGSQFERALTVTFIAGGTFFAVMALWNWGLRQG